MRLRRMVGFCPPVPAETGLSETATLSTRDDIVLFRGGAVNYPPWTGARLGRISTGPLLSCGEHRVPTLHQRKRVWGDPSDRIFFP